MLREQAEELRAATATDGVRDERALVGVRARLQQQPHVIEAIFVEGVRQRVRPARFGAVLEQEPETRRVLGLGRVVERLAVVRARPGLEQDARQLRIMCDPGRTVERRHPAILVAESHVRIRAALEQLAREPRRGEARVADVEERRPSARPSGLVRITRPAAAEDEPRPRVALDLGTRGQKRFGAGPPSVGRGKDEGLGVRLDRHDQRGPARVPVLACQSELGVREGDALPHRRVRPNSGERLLVSRPRGARELLRLLAQLLEIHGNLLPFDPASACSGGKETLCCYDRGSRWALPCPRTGGALARTRTIAPQRAERPPASPDGRLLAGQRRLAYAEGAAVLCRRWSSGRDIKE